MQGRPGDGRGAGFTRRRSPPTDGCCIQEEEDEAQTDMHAQHTVDDEYGGSIDTHARGLYTQLHTMNEEEAHTCEAPARALWS